MSEVPPIKLRLVKTPRRTYRISGREEKTNKLRFIDCTDDKDRMLSLVRFQRKMKTFIFQETGIDLKLPIVIVLS